MKKFLLCASAFALLLGSCSKDDADSAAVEVTGKVAFSASMTIGEGVSTRTHLEPDGTGKYKYYWDDGDMVGATVNNGSEIVPFIVAKGGTEKAQFVVVDEDLAYLGDPTYYLVYPYDKSATVWNYNVSVTIPASQRYRENSFATMTAPAVAAIAEEYDSENTQVTMQPVASYIRVPVTGAGKLTALELNVKNSEDKYVVLNGSYTVNLKNIASAATKATVDGAGDDRLDENNKVTISFGNGSIGLEYEKPAYLWFVVPADMPLKGSTLTFKATVNGAEQTVEIVVPDAASTTLARNQYLSVPTISVGTENMVMIKNTEDFLKYAFAANYNAAIGLSDDPINDSIVAEYYKDGKFKTAVLLADLNYRNYAAQDVYQDAVQSEEQDEILLEALKSYMQNGGGIASFDSAVSIDGNGHKISYLPVYGNGIFAAAPSLLKDLTIQQATVNVPDGTKTAASFLGRLTSFRNVSGVTIYSGSLLNVAEGVTPTMVGASASASTLPTKAQMTISRYPSVNGVAADNAYYAATLTVNADVDAYNADKRDFFNTATPRFAKFKGSKDGVIISKVSNATIAKVILDAVDTTGKSFSVMDRANVSYWTGTVPASVTDDGIVTAEDLAYYVQNGGNVTLTNNIDLQGEQGKEWVLDNGSAALNITGNGKYTISNALVKSQKVADAYVAYSLLGNVVNATDIVVDGVDIVVDNVEGSTAQLYVGGIGYQGSANGVKVNDLTIDIAEDVKVSTYNEVGGLISAPTAASKENAVTDLSINVNGNETVGPVGCLFGKAPASFNGNVLTWSEGATATGAMIGAWTVTDDFAGKKAVENCNAGEAPIVDILTVDAANGGQTLVLEFNNCSEKIYNEIVNPNSYTTTIKLNGELQEIAPSK